MALIIHDTWNVTLKAERRDDDELAKAFDAKFAKALAIIEDELRHEFGDVEVDWGQ